MVTTSSSESPESFERGGIVVGEIEVSGVVSESSKEEVANVLTNAEDTEVVSVDDSKVELD